MILKGSYSGKLEWNGLEVCYSVDTSCDYSYTPGRMYMSNGDPGYPDEEDYDDPGVDEISDLYVGDSEGNDLTDQWADNEELEQAIIDDADNNQDDWSWDEPDYVYEPDFENPEWED